MSNTTSSNPASLRIANLLDEGSFVEIGGQVTARATDFNMQEKKAPTAIRIPPIISVGEPELIMKR